MKNIPGEIEGDLPIEVSQTLMDRLISGKATKSRSGVEDERGDDAEGGDCAEEDDCAAEVEHAEGTARKQKDISPLKIFSQKKTPEQKAIPVDKFANLLEKISDCSIDSAAFTQFVNGMKSSQEFDVDVFLSSNHHRVVDRPFLHAWFKLKTEQLDYNSFLTSLSTDLSKLHFDSRSVQVRQTNSLKRQKPD